MLCNCIPALSIIIIYNLTLHLYKLCVWHFFVLLAIALLILTNKNRFLLKYRAHLLYSVLSYSLLKFIAMHVCLCVCLSLDHMSSHSHSLQRKFSFAYLLCKRRICRLNRRTEFRVNIVQKIAENVIYFVCAGLLILIHCCRPFIYYKIVSVNCIC